MRSTHRGGWVLVGLALVLAVGPVAVAGAGAETTAPGAEVGTADWKKVSSGQFHTCGIRTSGRLYCWGWDDHGQLGDGGTNTDQPAPVEVAGGATDWSTVEAGAGHTCARRTTGRLYCWGFDAVGQLGDGGTNTDQGEPVEVAGGATNWSAVSAGANHTCALKTNGRLFCWGFDANGQLGDGGTDTNRTTPTQVAGASTSWDVVSVGGSHTCARKTNGRLFCWGHDEFGKIGDGGTTTNRPTPTQVAGSATTWATVSAGDLHTCARKTNGRLFCWGYNVEGELGTGGPSTPRTTPTQVAGGATDWNTVSVSGHHSCARRTTGRLYCWGFDFFGELGDGGSNANRAVPVEVAGATTDWTTVTVGYYHSCARRTSARLFCWGRDNKGQLGNGGSGLDQSVPVEIA